MKVLIIGDMSLGRNARSVFDGYVAAGHEVRSVDISAVNKLTIGSRLWWSIRRERSVTPEENARIAREITSVTEGFEPALLLAIKTIYYDQQMILAAPGAIKAHLSFDDVSNPDNTSPAYLQYESQWDVILTTKKHNVPELIARGARDVVFIWGAFDPRFRKRVVPIEDRQYAIGFIGAARPDRIDLPRQFASRGPGLGVIYGPRWKRSYPLGVKDVTMMPSSTGPAYTTAANSIQIGLVLLNSENRDNHTNRSIETPATGQLVLAERTDEHQELFVEGEEAVFFSSRDELWENVDRLLKSPDEVIRIANNGYARVTSSSGYTYKDRAAEFVAYIEGK